MKKLLKSALLFVVFFTFFTSAFTSAGETERKKIRMQAGESRVMKLDFDVYKIATGNPEVCEATRTAMREVLLNAIKTGETNVLIWDKTSLRMEITLSVSLNDAETLATQLRELMHDIEGVEIKAVGNKVLVEGEVFSKKDLDRVNRIVKDMPDTLNLVKMSPILKQILVSEIKKAIKNKNIRVKTARDSFILEGIVYNEADKERAEQVAKAYSDNVVNVIKVLDRGVAAGPSKMVQMTLSIMEVDKGALNDLGVHWNPGGTFGAAGQFAGGTNQADSLTGAITGTISNLFPKMRKLKEHGNARSLFQQSVITKSGDKAQFFVGDEIPIPVAQRDGIMSVEYKKVGLTLNFSPIIDRGTNIDTKVDVGSSFVAGEGPGGAPKIKSTSLQSAVYVKSGNSIALGGLIGQRELRSTSGSPPGGGSALVQLNKSRKFQHGQSEVLLFVTPTILKNERDAIDDMGRKVKKTFKNYERENIHRKPIGD